MVHHCFTLDQQQKITKSKYIPNKGYAVLDESNSDDVINAAAEEGIFDTTLGLSERENQSSIAGKGHVASKIMFREAKEGAVEAHNFSSSVSSTTIHSKNVNDSKSVASQKTLAKSVFSLATSRVTSDGSEEEEMDEDEGSDFDKSATKPSGVEIKGMQMLTREQSKNESSVTGQEEELGENEEEAQLTKNMNKATAQLKLSLVDKEQDMEEDEEEFNGAMDREVDSKEETSYVVHCSDSPSLSAKLNPDSDDEGGKDFLEDDLSVHLADHYQSNDYNSASEVASGVFDASHTTAFGEPNTFKELL
jgi:hypothetical protein